jgi:erythromycin esterase-like protein
MWRNADVLDFVGWLRAFNDALPNGAERAGFYGLDLYSLHTSMAAVLSYSPEGRSPPRNERRCDTAASTRSAMIHSGTDTRPRSGSRLRANRRSWRS